MRDLNKTNLIKKMTEKEEIPLKFLNMNINEDDSVTIAFEKILDESKRIDFLVNNAGFGLFGALEDLSIEDIKKQFETNLFGAVRTVKEVLPIMRVQKSGIIVNISSLAGYVGFPTQSAYASTKFALEGLCESLAYEVEQYGIKIVLVEPGIIKTKFVENMLIPINTRLISSSLLTNSDSSSTTEIHSINSRNSNSSDDNKSQKEITEYADVVKRFLSHYYYAVRNGPDPKQVAEVIFESIKKSASPTNRGNFFRYPVGQDAKFYLEAKKKMNDSELHSLVVQRTLS
jgi:short-subunit dehydrogenase